MSEVMTQSGTGKPARRTYKSKYKPTWCPGCGDFGVLAALDRALGAYACEEHDLCLVAGIGCSSRFPFFMNTYGIHSAHGRALAVATGLKVARPDLTVVATGGDGDALAIGGNHFFHTMRRNVDITYIMMDNQIYGMTKGQAAPTSHVDMRTKSSPYGVVETPVDPVWAALTMGATYVAQGASHEFKQLSELILGGIRHHGMAFINVLSPCVTFNADMDKDFVVQHSVALPEGHDPADYLAALKVIHDNRSRFPLGLIYKHEGSPSMEDGIETIRKRVGAGAASLDLRQIAADFM
jgi:2-oxoglutarate ferredoxin oxidoreductase subunit beta